MLWKVWEGRKLEKMEIIEAFDLPQLMEILRKYRPSVNRIQPVDVKRFEYNEETGEWEAEY